MEENKIKSFKEHAIEKNAKKNLEAASKYHTDPIKAKFCAFQKTKKDINIKDLF